MQFCAIAAACCQFVLSFGSYALQGKGFASAESVTCSTLMRFVLHLSHLWLAIGLYDCVSVLIVCQNMLCR